MIANQQKSVIAYKTHTNGNKLLLIDSTPCRGLTIEQISHYANKHPQADHDQVITYQHHNNHADCQFFNRDGSSAELCLNGVYALANHLKSRSPKLKSINTQHACFKMIDRRDSTLTISVPNCTLKSIEAFHITTGAETSKITQSDVVNVGNPHLLIRTTNIEHFALKEFATSGSILKSFPKGINISAYTRSGTNSIQMRTHERGAGLTLGCGSAALSIFFLEKNTTPSLQKLNIKQPGGTTTLEHIDNHIYMQATYESVGKIEINDLHPASV